MQKTGIEWTDATWNPMRGCTKISPGCKFCYAEVFAERFRGVPGHPYRRGFDLRLVPEKLTEPLRWKKPRMIFVNSMSDLFHEDVPESYIAAVFGIMKMARHHTFQVLTKRAKRMADILSRMTIDGIIKGLFEWLPACGGSFDSVLPIPNVWLGVSCENQKYADERIPLLIQTPAAIRFISAEPLLGPIDLHRIQWPGRHKVDVLRGGYWEDRDTFFKGFVQHGDFPAKLDQVIVGGESGPGARPMELAWARMLRDQCVAFNKPYFFKQWGAWIPDGQGMPWLTDVIGGRRAHESRVIDGLTYYRRGKGKTGNLLDGKEWAQMPGVADHV